MTNRITPEKITNLESNQIFVFGSNLSGIHGAGAARTALNFGARYSQAVGLQGSAYAIPTKNETITRTLLISEIKPFVDDFIKFAKMKSNLIFLVTEIGCGLAGYKPNDIAPLFQNAINVNNIHLPISFWNVLNK